MKGAAGFVPYQKLLMRTSIQFCITMHFPLPPPHHFPYLFLPPLSPPFSPPFLWKLLFNFAFPLSLPFPYLSPSFFSPPFCGNVYSILHSHISHSLLSTLFYETLQSLSFTKNSFTKVQKSSIPILLRLPR